MTPLFVYGTLCQGFSNHQLLQGCPFVGNGTVPGTILVDLGGCPGLLFARSGSEDWARGEVYDIRPKLPTILANLDQLENEGKFYRRLIAPVQLTDGGYKPCWVYAYLPALQCDNCVRGGVWRC